MSRLLFWAEKVARHFHHLHATQPTWAVGVACHFCHLRTTQPTWVTKVAHQLQSTQNGCSCLSDPFSFFSSVHCIPARQYSYSPLTPAFSSPLCPTTTIPCILLKEYKHLKKNQCSALSNRYLRISSKLTRSSRPMTYRMSNPLYKYSNALP